MKGPAAALALLLLHTAAAAAPIEVRVYKPPACGCCSAWADHLRAAGFAVREIPHDGMEALKRRLGVPPGLASCHTAQVGGYLVEGHVPASAIRRLLAERPTAAGLSAPGMPRRSPGMQPPGLPPAGYTVYVFDREGEIHPFARYPDGAPADRDTTGTKGGTTR